MATGFLDLFARNPAKALSGVPDAPGAKHQSMMMSYNARTR
jgi:hypothetical protein